MSGHCEHCAHCEAKKTASETLETEVWETFSNIWKKHFGVLPRSVTAVNYVTSDISLAKAKDSDLAPTIENLAYTSVMDHTDVSSITIKEMLEDYSHSMLELCGKHTESIKNTCDKVFIVLPLSITRDNTLYTCKPKCVYKKDIEEQHPRLKLFQGWENDYPDLTGEVFSLPVDHYPQITDAKNMRDRYSALKKALQCQDVRTKGELTTCLVQEYSTQK
jgi:hypothetical protein